MIGNGNDPQRGLSYLFYQLSGRQLAVGRGRVQMEIDERRDPAPRAVLVSVCSLVKVGRAQRMVRIRSCLMFRRTGRENGSDRIQVPREISAAVTAPWPSLSDATPGRSERVARRSSSFDQRAVSIDLDSLITTILIWPG